MSTRPDRRCGTERGATAVLAALLAVLLFSVLGIVTDFGLAYSNVRNLQNGADAAALAVARKVALEGLDTANCATLAATYNTSAMRAEADKHFTANKQTAGAQLSSGSAGFKVACESVGGVDRVVVSVNGSQRSPKIFGGVMSSAQLDVARAAKAIVGPASTVIGLRPFAVCEAIANTVKDSPGISFVVPLTNASSGCGSAPGNFGMLDFNGGSNPTGEMKDWILNGYDDPVSVAPPVLIDGDPGFNVNAAVDETSAMMALDEIALPVFDQVTGNGANTKFRIVGFVTVVGCRYRINNKSGPAPADVNPECSALPVSPPPDYIQLAYKSFVPISEISKVCVLANTACDHGTRTFKLAD